jgi:hypothetical protein
MSHHKRVIKGVRYALARLTALALHSAETINAWDMATQ